MIHIKCIAVGYMQVNCYIVSSDKTKDAILIDPGDDYKKIKSFLDKHKLKPKFIVHTHGHIDHIGADNEFDLPVYIHRLDSELLVNPEKNLSRFFTNDFKVKNDVVEIEDSSMIALDDLTFKVLHTPGHTPGGICLKGDGLVFTGDTLFNLSVGRADFPYASQVKLMNSIRDKLLVLPDETVIYPGHGASSTIGREKASNPFLSSY